MLDRPPTDTEKQFADKIAELAVENERLRAAVNKCVDEFLALSRDGTRTVGVQNMWGIVAERVKQILTEVCHAPHRKT